MKRFIEKWEDLLGTEWANDAWKMMTEALFYLRSIPPDSEVGDTLSAAELSFPGFVPNQDQLRVAQKVIKGTEPVLNVEGPPGTGKSTLIAAIVRLLTKRDPEARILVCGPSNKSSDNICNLLTKIQMQTEDTDDSSLRVLRIYSTPLEQVQKSNEIPFALHVLAAKETTNNKEHLAELEAKHDELHLLQGKGPEEVQEFAQKAHALIKEIEEIQKRLQAICFETTKPNVVVTTCYGSGTHWLESWEPTHVIVDEVGQAQVVESLFACAWISKMHAQQIILVGDRHQLAPVVLSGGTAGQILSTCLSAFLEDSQMVVRIRLRRCYHMHPCMLRFINHMTYNGELFTTVTPAERASIAQVYRFPQPNEPQVFYEVQGIESQPAGQPSHRNDAESEVVVEIVRELVEECEVSIWDCAVLAFYEAQRRLITKRLFSH